VIYSGIRKGGVNRRKRNGCGILRRPCVTNAEKGRRRWEDGKVCNFGPAGWEKNLPTRRGSDWGGKRRRAGGAWGESQTIVRVE